MSDGQKIYLGEVGERLKERLDYGDNLSEWVREAIKLRLELVNDEDPTFTHPEESD